MLEAFVTEEHLTVSKFSVHSVTELYRFTENRKQLHGVIANILQV